MSIIAARALPTLALIVLLCAGGEAQEQEQDEPTTSSVERCAEGTLVDRSSGRCAPIRDRQEQPEELAQPEARTLPPPVQPPPLSVMRGGRTPTRITPPATLSAPEPPPPGGIGAGILYEDGKLVALEQGELQTTMFVYPEGYQPSNLGLDWLFTTATNRVEQTVELVAIYFRDNNNGDLGVFDWSCSEEYPCQDGGTTPRWIWIANLQTFQCNMANIVDPGGHKQEVIRYHNASVKLDEQTPPLWVNQVLLWNYCDDAWDLIYEHEYRVDQRDCSQGSACAWWGPILETFPSSTGEPFPEINELGFTETALLHDGVWSSLPPSEAAFSPPQSPWALFHLEPNRGFGVGNRVVQAVVFEFRPLSRTPRIRPGRRGNIQAAVLSPDGVHDEPLTAFDAETLDPGTIRVGPGGAEPENIRYRDVNRDGLTDLLFANKISALGITCGDTFVEMTASTFGGDEIWGQDAIRTVGCKSVGIADRR